MEEELEDTDDIFSREKYLVQNQKLQYAQLWHRLSLDPQPGSEKLLKKGETLKRSTDVGSLLLGWMETNIEKIVLIAT